jgi:hypothetical protein
MDGHPEHFLLVPVEQPLEGLVIPALPEQFLDILGHPTISYSRPGPSVAADRRKLGCNQVSASRV